MKELKNCPFCGGAADLWAHANLVYVKCDICGAESQVFHLSEAEEDNWIESTAALKAITKWNNRVKEHE